METEPNDIYRTPDVPRSLATRISETSVLLLCLPIVGAAWLAYGIQEAFEKAFRIFSRRKPLAERPRPLTKIEILAKYSAPLKS